MWMSFLRRGVSLAIAIAVSMAASLTLSPPAQAQQILAGGDCWVTDPGDSQLVFDDMRTVPADFFGVGSLPIPANMGDSVTVLLRGDPLDPLIVSQPIAQGGCGCPQQVEFEMTWVDRHGVTVGPDDRHRVRKVDGPPISTEVDTCVQRTGDVNFSGTGTTETVGIQLIALSLKSIQPIEVQFDTNGDNVVDFTQLFDVFVRNSGPMQYPGQMSFVADEITPSGPMNGTMDLESLPVTFEIEFKEHQNPASTLPVLGPFDLIFGRSEGTFSMSTASASMIPTLSTWGLILLTLLLMMSGAILFKRLA